MINASITYDPSIAKEDLVQLKRVEPWVREGLIVPFCLSCDAHWTNSGATQSDRFFTLSAQTINGEVSLGEFALSFLKSAGATDLNANFQEEYRRVYQQTNRPQQNAENLNRQSAVN